MRVTTHFPDLPVKPLPRESSNPSIFEILVKEILVEVFEDHSSANWRVYGLLGTASLVGQDGPFGIRKTDRLVFGKKHPVSYPGAKGQAERDDGGVQADLTIVRSYETLEIAFKYVQEGCIQEGRHNSLDQDQLKNLVSQLKANKSKQFAFATNVKFGAEFKEKIEEANQALTDGDPDACPRIHLLERLE